MDFDPKLLVKDKLGNTPLHYAAEKYPEVLNTLLKKAQELGMENAQCSQTVMTSSWAVCLPIKSRMHWEWVSCQQIETFYLMPTCSCLLATFSCIAEKYDLHVLTPQLVLFQETDTDEVSLPRPE